MKRWTWSASLAAIASWGVEKSAKPMGCSPLKFTCEASYPGNHLSRFWSSLSFTSSGRPDMKIVRTWQSNAKHSRWIAAREIVWSKRERERDLVRVGTVRVFDENGRRVGRGRRGTGCGWRRSGSRRPLLVVGMDSGTGHLERCEIRDLWYELGNFENPKSAISSVYGAS